MCNYKNRPDSFKMHDQVLKFSSLVASSSLGDTYKQQIVSMLSEMSAKRRHENLVCSLNASLLKGYM